MAHLRTERHEAVAVVILDDPGRRNALSEGLCAELTSTIEELVADEVTSAVVITGAGPAFCAGADLSQLGDSRELGLRAIYSGFLSVARCPLPTIAAVNGPAVGAGMNLALACDVRIAGPDARFECRFLDLGIHPGGGHTWMLQRLVGPQTAAAMLLFGEVLDAQDSVGHGLTWEHVGADELLERAIQLAAHAAAVPPELSSATKATLAEMAAVDDHGEAVERELAKQLVSMDTPAFAERLEALRARISRG